MSVFSHLVYLCFGFWFGEFPETHRSVLNELNTHHCRLPSPMINNSCAREYVRNGNGHNRTPINYFQKKKDSSQEDELNCILFRCRCCCSFFLHSFRFYVLFCFIFILVSAVGLCVHFFFTYNQPRFHSSFWAINIKRGLEKLMATVAVYK